MKRFRYPKGHEFGDTLTVGELKELLDNMPDGMPVLATWEEQLKLVETYEVITPDMWHQDDNEPCLVFDVN